MQLYWEPFEIESFLELKKRMTQCLDLNQPNYNQPYVLRCDASDFAIGAVLLQEFEGKERPVDFYSRKLAKIQPH